jgi:hypothetical protein
MALPIIFVGVVTVVGHTFRCLGIRMSNISGHVTVSVYFHTLLHTNTLETWRYSGIDRTAVCKERLEEITIYFVRRW